MSEPRAEGHASSYSAPDFAERYAAFRPRPPGALLDVLVQLASVERPRLVVDLGSGTGLSTFVWADRADEVVGVEISDAMITQAEARCATLPNAQNVRFVYASAAQTDLPDGCADIVTCAQSLHWMEPEPTFSQVARILRDGGVFAAYSYNLPLTLNWEMDAAHDAFEERLATIVEGRGIKREGQRWSKSEHLQHIEASGVFRYTGEFALHNLEMGNAERLIGLTLSLGSVADPLTQGLSEEELGLCELRGTSDRLLGNELKPWLVCYDVWVGVK